MTVSLLRIGADGFTDYDALLALILRSFAYMDPLIDPPSSAHRLTVKNLEEKARDEIGIAAVEGERLLGCAFLRVEPEFLYVGKLAVDPDLQGRGTGRLLLREAERIALEAGRPTLRLETRIELAGNHARFASWGFIRTAENRHAGYDRTTSIEMQKQLA